MQIKHALLLSCMLIAVPNVAGAQTPPSPPAHVGTPVPDHVAAGCAPTQTTPQGNITPEGTTTGQSPAPLGDKLAKSDGVLCPPPGVDPQMRAPVPDAGTGSMPVIPPPGSPGGDPDVRPK